MTNRFTLKHEQMACVPKLNSALFTYDNYNNDNSILLYPEKIQKYAIGWCYSEETTIPKSGLFNNDIAIMYEVPEGELIDAGRYWCHISKMSFADLLIPNFWNDDDWKGEEV